MVKAKYISVKAMYIDVIIISKYATASKKNQLILLIFKSLIERKVTPGNSGILDDVFFSEYRLKLCV